MAGALHGVLASLKAAAASATDTFFRYVSLLLNTTSTNGAQNNTFLDGSTNAFSITRNGNTTQGTFSPFSQTGWSNYFDGTGDYLTAPDNAAWSFGSGDFTVEAWYYPTGTAAQQIIVAQWDGVGGGTGLSWVLFTSNNSSVFLRAAISSNGSGVLFDLVSTSALTINAWNHVALVRSGTTFQLYLNGAAATNGSTTNAASLYDATNALSIGASSGGTQFATGYISNVRVLKGTAQYSGSTYTVPTSPLTAITNTSLLTCQSNRFIDNSSNAFAITRNGDVSVQAFSPFSPTAAWSASTNGGSGYFDGAGDYLTTPLGQAPLQLSNSDFTFEAWVYRTGGAATQCITAGPSDYATAAGSSWVFYVATGATTSDLYVGSTAYSVTSPNAPLNTWAHVAWVRTGGTYSTYLNGSRVATLGTLGTSTVNNGITNPVAIGGFANGSNQFTGYISNARLIKGSGGYDATQTTITVPTSPLTAITNTSLLLNFTNAGIYDSASGNDLETVGNAQVSTVQSKWGTTSMAFDGTGDWLVQIDRPALRLGTAAFTIEMWVYRSASGTYGLISKGTSTTGWSVSLNASNQVVFSFAASSITSTGTVAATTWTHVAVVREGTGTNQTKIYISGTNDGTGTVATDFSGTDVMYVGADRVAGSAFNGYIDDLRITNGYARYTANFTPPAAAFPLN